MASWLVRSSPGRAARVWPGQDRARVRALDGARQFTFTGPLST